MVTIHTGRLREQSDILYREALQYNQRLSELEACITWLRRQEFDEVDELLRLLHGQYEKLGRQKEEMLKLSGLLQRICGRYEAAEQEIIESPEAFQKLRGFVKTMHLADIRECITALGIRITL